MFERLQPWTRGRGTPRSFVLMALACALAPRAGVAQEPAGTLPIADPVRAALQPGSAIRLEVPGYGRGLFRATIAAITPTTLVVRTHLNVPQSTIPRDSIVRLQIATGERSQFAHWGLRGAALGAELGAFLGAATAKREQSPSPCPAAEPFCGLDRNSRHALGKMGRGALVGVVAGGVIGAAVGSFYRHPRWRDVPPGRLAVMPPSGGSGWQVGVGLSF